MMSSASCSIVRSGSRLRVCAMTPAIKSMRVNSVVYSTSRLPQPGQLISAGSSSVLPKRLRRETSTLETRRVEWIVKLRPKPLGCSVTMIGSIFSILPFRPTVAFIGRTVDSLSIAERRNKRNKNWMLEITRIVEVTLKIHNHLCDVLLIKERIYGRLVHRTLSGEVQIRYRFCLPDAVGAILAL